MNSIKKLLGAVLPLALVLTAPVQARDWNIIKESGTIIAATEGAFAPFNYFEGKKLTGYEVDVAEAIAKKMGLKLEWRAVPFDSQLAAVSQDRYDFAIASHGYTEERAKAVDFATPHYCTGGQIAAATDGPLTKAALKDKTVGVQLATSYFDAAKKIDGVKDVKTYKSDPEAFSALRAKKINAWISDKDQQFGLELTVVRLLSGGRYRPEPWRPADSLVWAKLMALGLDGNNQTARAGQARLGGGGIFRM